MAPFVIKDSSLWVHFSCAQGQDLGVEVLGPGITHLGFRSCVLGFGAQGRELCCFGVMDAQSEVGMFNVGA